MRDRIEQLLSNNGGALGPMLCIAVRCFHDYMVSEEKAVFDE